MLQTHLVSAKKVLIFDTLPNSLAVQKVHDGLQHIVRLLNHAAIGRYCLTFDLGQDVPHLPHIVQNLGLETTITQQQTLTSAKEDGRSDSLFQAGIVQIHSPDSEDVAEVVHDAVEFVLKLLQEVTCLHIELEKDKWE